jgi:hypothetical protein
MHKWILMVSLFIGATAQAHATTYEYTGAQFTYFSGLCGPDSCTKVSGSGDDAVSLYSEPLNALVLSSASSSEAGGWVGEFFADPVPEPSTWALLLIGFAGDWVCPL